MGKQIIEETQNLRIDYLKDLDYLDLYSYFIEIGHDLPNMNNCSHTELLKGCQNEVNIGYWISDGKMYFTGSSTSGLMKGVIMMLSFILSSHYAIDIFNSKIFIFDKIGLSSGVSSLRSVGINNIIDKFKEFSKNNM